MVQGETQTQSRLSFMDVFRFVAGYWLRQPKKFAIILLLFMAAAFLETNLPNALSAFLGAIREQSNIHAIYVYLTLFLCNYFAYVILFSISGMLYNSFETRVFNHLMDDIFSHVQHLSEQFFINTFTGSIISKITRGRSRIETFEDQIILRVLPTGTVLISSVLFLAPHFPVLAALMAVYLIILVVISILLVFRIAGPAQEAYANEQDSFAAYLADSVSGITTIKAYAQEPRELSRFFQLTSALRLKNFRAYYLSSATTLIQQLLLGGMLVLLLGGGTWYFLHGRATIEDMAYLALAYTIIQSYVRELGENVKTILTSSYDLHAIIALMREVPGVQDAPGSPALTITNGAITFDNVSFTYPGKNTPIFKDLSVTIRAGERVALVGHSGSGKTTFVRLIQRLYDVPQGSILIDGQPIAGGSQQSLRSSIALVPQDPILFHRSLRDNIAYANPTATLEEIRQAAAQAHIDDFIMHLPEQYETLVGERGIKLSGGERQRVAIARAILANRPILILDEATSSLDSVSEKAIQDALHKLIQGRTSIMVAHRLSTIQDADRILVFDRGSIVEEGTHDQLIQKQNGVYAGFFKLQTGGFIGE